jgi:hypothetical protein
MVQKNNTHLYVVIVEPSFDLVEIELQKNIGITNNICNFQSIHMLPR